MVSRIQITDVENLESRHLGKSPTPYSTITQSTGQRSICIRKIGTIAEFPSLSNPGIAFSSTPASSTGSSNSHSQKHSLLSVAQLKKMMRSIPPASSSPENPSLHKTEI
jgi:hypothetical protein